MSVPSDPRLYDAVILSPVITAKATKPQMKEALEARFS